MPTRYKRNDIIINSSPFYAPLRRERGLKSVRQYGTIKLYNPSILERASVKTAVHLWSYGDRLYKLAHTYYGDSRYWWVIAWWNGYGTEAAIPTGIPLTIPLNIEKALKALRV